MPPANDRGSVSLDRSSGFAPKSDKVAALLQPRPGYQETASAGDPLGKTLGAVRMSGALFFVVATTTPFCIDVPHTRAYADIIRPHAGGGDLLDRLIDMTMDVAQAGGPGGAGVSARLSELLLIELLRQYAAAPVDKPAGWLAGLGDPPIARALTALHERPAAPWTVAALAREAGMSRSAFAGRFLERVGHAPMRYLTLWRMQLAAAELDETEAPLAAIAAKVGYASEAAFSRGFKRAAGLSPDAWRRRDRSSAATPPSDAAQA
ncbi:MAG: AraC family transcriptional regulator [Alphaproteobacteria bacterium]